MSDFNKKLYNQNLKIFTEKKGKSKKNGFQVSFLSNSEEIVAIIATMKTITGESQKQFIEEAIKEKAKRDYPEIY